MSHDEDVMNNLQISPVEVGKQKLIARMQELYCYDLSQWFDLDMQADGLFHVPVKNYWENDGAVFVASLNDLPVGFAVVQAGGADAEFDMKAFFVLRKFRRHGVGHLLAGHVWDQFRGRWQVRVFDGNAPAVPFWRDVVAGYTNGEFHQEAVMRERAPWTYFRFLAG